MSITDAKDPASWQIGFEDGIKFALILHKHMELGKAPSPCAHEWVNNTYCEKCGASKE